MLCSSYSGNTEETLACFEAAEALGARRVVASTGGELVDGAREAGVPVVGLPGIFQPRAAVAYMFAVAAEVAALAGAAPRIHTEIDAAAAFLEAESEALQARAAEIAARLEERLPVVYGADLTTPVGTALEDAGQRERQAARLLLRAARGRPQRALRLGGRRGGRFAAVFLEDCDQHPRERRRFELTAAAVARGRRRRGSARDRGRDPGRAPALGDDARRPRLARTGAGARRRPAAGRGDRALKEEMGRP